MRTFSRLLLLVVVGSALATGCRLFRRHPPASAPPFETFKPGVWQPPKGPAIQAPEATGHAWRVLALQEQPRPKKNPQFRPIAISESGLLELPRGSRFLCLYNPVVFRPWNNEMMKVERWDVVRTVRCSSDRWRTYSQAVLTVSFDKDGKQVGKSADQAELYLHEQMDGKPFDETILLRAD